MSDKKISIIMRSKNSDWVIGSALAAIYSQEFTEFELLVVDSGSTDKTLDIVRQYPCRLVEIEAKSYYPGVVLNDAIDLCNSEIIVFINSDSVMLSPKSLGNIVRHFDRPDVAGAFGRQAPRPDAHTWVVTDYMKSFPERGDAPPWITLSLPLAAVRRSVWEEHRFYTEAWASEDSEWGHWAREKGKTIIYDPEALTMHSHNYTLQEIYGRRYVEGEADAFIYSEKTHLVSMVINTIRAILKDGIAHVSAFDLPGFLASPARRGVYHWAYYRGNLKGNQRIATGDTDASAGQQVVLDSVATAQGTK